MKMFFSIWLIVLKFRNQSVGKCFLEKMNLNKNEWILHRNHSDNTTQNARLPWGKLCKPATY